LNAAPLASRIVSGAICGAAIHSTRTPSVAKGAVLGGLGAFAASITAYHIRQRLDRNMPDIAVALLEDALAVAGGAMIVALGAR
jgi:uncharacterized membrane protein